MIRIVTALLLCAAAEAATLNVNLTVNATLTSSGTSYAAAGTAALSGGITDTGTFTATLDLTTVSSSGAPFTITLSKGTMGGTLVIPLSTLTSIITGATSASGASATITSATGSYAGDTGTFPSLSGSGGIGASGITAMFTGAGTIATGGTITNPPPAVTAVQNDASNAYGTAATVAQGSLFVVKGTNMSADGYTSLALPYPKSSGSTSVTFTPTAGGSGTAAYLFYTYSVSGVNQLGGIVPSTLATGNYNLTVSYNGSTSANFPVTVVAQNPGIFTQDTSGSGLGVVQNIISVTQYDIDRLTTGSVGGYTVSPAKPGQTIIVWATGLGPVSYGDNIVPPQAYNYPNVQVIIGGTSITPLYAGASGYAGLDQINVTLPANVATGCTVSLQVSSGGVTSPATTISIAPDASSSACVLPGYTSTQLAALDAGGSITAGNFTLSQFTESLPSLGTATFSSASGGFTQITGFQLGSAASLNSFSQTTIGSCIVTKETLGSNGQVVSGGGVTNLDAGTVKLSGPTASTLSNTALLDSNGAYSLTIGETGLGLPGAPTGVLAAGTYSLSGSGGTGVGSFNSSITIGAPLTIVGGLPSSVNRSQPLVLAWTGGNSTDVVDIYGYSGVATGSGTNSVTTATSFQCTTTAGTGGFTVPAQVLAQLPATPASTAGGSGFLEVASGPPPVSFNAPLVPSGTVASTFLALVGSGATVVYQ